MEIEERGLSLTPHVPLDAPWDYSAMYAHYGSLIIGAIQFRFTEWNRTVATAFSYTLPAYRSVGVNRSLIEAIEKLAIEQGYRVIRRTTHPENGATQRAFEAAGYQLQSMDYTKLLIPNLDLHLMNHLGKKP